MPSFIFFFKKYVLSARRFHDNVDISVQVKNIDRYLTQDAWKGQAERKQDAKYVKINTQNTWRQEITSNNQKINEMLVLKMDLKGKGGEVTDWIHLAP